MKPFHHENITAYSPILYIYICIHTLFLNPLFWRKRTFRLFGFRFTDSILLNGKECPGYYRRTVRLNQCTAELIYNLFYKASCIAYGKYLNNGPHDFSSPVLMSPVSCQDEESVIAVCQEEDNDLRVDCLLEPKPNYHTDYEFSMSKGQKETIISTNISGIMPEPKFRHNTFVTELEPYGFRLTIMSFAITENTTFICKVTKIQKTLFVELGTTAELRYICST